MLTEGDSSNGTECSKYTGWRGRGVQGEEAIAGIEYLWRRQ